MNQRSIPRPFLAKLRWFEENRPTFTLAVVDGEAEHLSRDLQSALSKPTEGLLIRGCAGLAGLERMETALRVAEARLGLAEGATRLIASMADTARAVLALQKPLIASQRLIGLTWDRTSLRASLGCSDPSPLLDQARLQLLFAASAAGIPAFDWSMGDDPNGDEDACALGFAGVSIW